MEEEKKIPVTDEESGTAEETPVPEETAQEEEVQTEAETETAENREEPKGRRGEIKKLRRELEETKKALEASEARAKELDDRVLRIAAEYDNFRKRTQAERGNVYAGAVSDTLTGLLPVIDNLQYAAKYAGAPPERRVRADAAWAYIDVMDRGPGMSAAEREKAFDRFWRADN